MALVTTFHDEPPAAKRLRGGSEQPDFVGASCDECGTFGYVDGENKYLADENDEALLCDECGGDGE